MFLVFLTYINNVSNKKFQLKMLKAFLRIIVKFIIMLVYLWNLTFLKLNHILNDLVLMDRNYLVFLFLKCLRATFQATETHYS